LINFINNSSFPDEKKQKSSLTTILLKLSNIEWLAALQAVTKQALSFLFNIIVVTRVTLKTLPNIQYYLIS
jgi:hypothetical protein